jgi:hypothetical protein
MTPTENDLRAALRDGEGDGLNVERIVTHGRERAQRRSRLVNAAAITVVVAGVGVGLTFLGDSDKKNSAGSGAAAGGSEHRSSVQYGRSGKNAPLAPGAGAASVIPSAQRSAPSAAIGCPASLPRYLLPPTATDTGGSLFSGPAATVVVCAYGGDSAGQKATRVVLKGEDAKALVDSLEQTSARRPSGMCPDYRRADEQSLALIGLDASGERVGLVTTTLGRPACAVDVRNGKIVRYGWQPPAALTGKLAPVVPGGGGMSHSLVRPTESPTK